MAIEDEIINISDIDIGTDVLKNDKFIIETNNGTKLLAFKDLIINEDQITFANKLIQSTSDGEGADTFVETVCSYSVLTTNTTPGHVTTYSDVSGTIELGKFNYNGISHFQTLSGKYEQYDSRIKNLDTRLTEVETKVSDAGVSLTPSTSSVNFKVSNNGNVEVNSSDSTKFWIEFDTINLNPIDTHSGTTVQSANGTPFKIIYPSSNFTAGWYLFSGVLYPKKGSQNTGLKPDDWVKIIIKTSTGGVTEIEGVYAFNNGLSRTVTFNTVEYISPGDTIYIKTNDRYDMLKGSKFSGVRIVS